MNNKERDEIIRKRAFIVGGIFASIFSIPVLLITIFLINNEYVEYIKYGQILDSTIVSYKIKVQDGESEAPTYFINTHPINKDLINKTYNINISNEITFQIVDNGFPFNNKERGVFLNNSKIGDTVKIQLINNREARLLRWKNWRANESPSFKNKIWMFLIIIVLLVVFVGMNLRTYKIIRKK